MAYDTLVHRVETHITRLNSGAFDFIVDFWLFQGVVRHFSPLSFGYSYNLRFAIYYILCLLFYYCIFAALIDSWLVCKPAAL